MTDEQINVKIAELCGWRLRQESDGEFSLIDPKGEKVSADWDPSTTLESFSYALPNYCADLNACHEMEAYLTVNEMTPYLDELYRIVQDPHICYTTHGMATVGATAKQRALAFLKTKGIQTTQ
jgi:hypothetical protein